MNFSDFSVGILEAAATEYGLSLSKQGIIPIPSSDHSVPGKFPLIASINLFLYEFVFTLLSELAVFTTAKYTLVSF